jgi:hypothetical protein
MLMTQSAPNVNRLKWVYISGAAFAVALAAAIAFVVAAQRMRIPNGLYFVILIPLGLTAAAFLFGAMRSHATYKGTSTFGTLELGGPVVVLGLVVVGGMMANRVETFSLTVRVHGPAGASEIVREGRVTADLAGVRRTSSIGADGEVVFADVPGDLEGQKIRLIAEVPNFVSDTAAEQVVIPASHIIDLGLTPKRFVTAMRGTVRDRAGRVVRNAAVNFGAGAATAVSDSAGDFRVAISAAPGTVVPVTVSLKGTVVYDDNVTVAEQPALRIVVRAPSR